MIVEKNQENEAIYLGQVQENKVDIDRENIDFIASLLTTNLYSAPLESFLRETISNGEDAQKEAGVEDPLLMIITPDGDSHFKITIRDFGTGISEEKFDRIYRKIGTSTKRESNEYIGHFGIGKFASLAVSDVVNIVSYYNNKRYDYLMYKSGDGINIDRVSVKDGEYSNGLEVTVRLPNIERHTVLKIMYRFCFFEKLFLVDNSNLIFNQTSVDAFNKRKVYYNNDMAACDYINGSNIRAILYGKVLYPINSSFDYHSHIQGNIIYRFNIGELDVTPNRESLRYSNKTNQAISNKLKNVTTLFNDEITKQTSKGFDNVVEWYKYMNNTYITIKILNEPYKINQSTITTSVNTSVRGINMSPEIFKVINMIKHHLSSDNIKYQISSNIFYSGKHCWMGSERLLGIRDTDSFLVTEDVQYSSITKKYILTQVSTSYPNSVYVLNKKALETFKKELAFRLLKALRQPALYGISIKRNDDNVKKSIKVLFEDVNKVLTSFVCINNKDVPKSFKDSLKPAKNVVTTNKKDKKEVRSCVVERLKSKEIYCSSNYARDHVSIDTTYDLHELLTKFKHNLIVYGSKNDSTIKTIAALYLRSNSDFYIFVQVADSKLALLKDYRNTIEVNDFIISNTKKLRSLATVKNIRNKVKEITYLSSLLPSSFVFKCVHSKYVNELKNISLLFNKYGNEYNRNSRFEDITDILDTYIKKGWYDDFSNVLNNSFIQTLIKMQYYVVKDGRNKYSNYLFMSYLSKCKQVLPDTDEYVKFKNTLIN